MTVDRAGGAPRNRPNLAAHVGDRFDPQTPMTLCLNVGGNAEAVECIVGGPEADVSIRQS